MIQLSEQSTHLDEWVKEEVSHNTFPINLTTALSQISLYLTQHPEAVVIVPNLEGEISLTLSYTRLSPLVKIELIRQVYAGTTSSDTSHQLSYPILKTLLEMTSLTGSSVLSSISLSDHWEAIVIGTLFRIKRRKSVSEQESYQRSADDSIPVTITFLRDRFSVSVTKISDMSTPERRTDLPLQDELKELGGIRRAQILEQSTLTHLYRIPKNSHLTIRLC